jgi:CRISPR/Cas system CMR-associated protein Cmr1 (group 7 of RAMP superfamily)
MTTSEVRQAVEDQLREGVPFGLIEDYIEDNAEDSVKSALWLLAWAETDHGTRRAVIDSLLIDA